MASKFWVGGGSSIAWNATANTNWSLTSGGANNAAVPTSSDFVFFDANSGSGTSALSSLFTIQGIDFTGYTGTLTHAAGALTINTAAANALKFSAAMTYTPNSTSSTFTFTHTSGTAIVTSAGKALAGIILSGVGGTVQQADDLIINAIANSALTINNGVFDCNGHALIAATVGGSNSNTRSLLLGSSLTLGGNILSAAVIWNFVITTGLTFTKNSCNITILSPTTAILSYTFEGNLTYNGITVNPTTTGAFTNFGSSFTCSTFSAGAGTAILFQVNAIATIINAFTLVGTSVAPIMLSANSISAFATVSCPGGNCTIVWGILAGVTGTGGALFTATNSLQCAVNAGWSVSTPSDGSATGIAASVWGDLFSGGDFNAAGSAGELLKSMANLQFTVPAIGRGTVTTGASTTSIPTSAFTPATSASVANQLVGRVVLFDAATTTVALRGQVATISASSASATPTLTVSTLTATPASGDLFSVI